MKQVEIKQAYIDALEKMSLKELDDEMHKLLVFQGKDKDDSGKLDVFLLKIEGDVKKSVDELVNFFESGHTVLDFKWAGAVVQFFDVSVPSKVLTWDDVKFVQYLVAGTVIKNIQNARALKSILAGFWPANKLLSEVEEKIGFVAKYQVRKEQEEATGLQFKEESGSVNK
jgi:hypothetical protein